MPFDFQTKTHYFNLNSPYVKTKMFPIPRKRKTNPTLFLLEIFYNFVSLNSNWLAFRVLNCDSVEGGKTPIAWLSPEMPIIE